MAMKNDKKSKKPDFSQKKAVDGKDSIGNLRNDLYKKRESGEILKRMKDLSTPPKFSSGKDGEVQERPKLVNVLKARAQTRKKVWIWVGIASVLAIAFVIAAAVTVWYRDSRQVTQEQMGLAISAPVDHTAGETVTYTISYMNDSRVAWQNVEIFFDEPDGFTYEASLPDSNVNGSQRVFSVGVLPSGEAGQVEVSGRLLGEQSQSALARAELALSPENFPKARFTKSETFSTEIVAVPLEVIIQADVDAGNGERMLADFVVRNTSDVVISGAYLRISPGIGLQLAPEDEQFSVGYSVLDSWWELPPIEPLGEVSRRAVVHVSGTPGEKRTISAEGLVRQGEDSFVLRRLNHVVSVSASELSVVQTFNENEESIVVVPGQEVKAKIGYANVGTVGLKNVVVSVAFEGSGFNADALNLVSGGAYNPATNTITWSAASVPELAALLPGQRGVLEYDFAISPLEDFPVDETGVNQNLIAMATIDSADLPTPVGQDKKVISNRFVLPLGTELTLGTTSFYDDGRLGITSSGPVPPEVGEETTYTVRFRIGSALNDTGEVRMSAILPDGVRYTDSIYVTQGEVDFNERTGEILWTIPKVDALTGRAAPEPELHVQVAIVPGGNLRGEIVPLLQSAQVEGLDLFTDAIVKTVVGAAELPSTETAVPDSGKVE